MTNQQKDIAIHRITRLAWLKLHLIPNSSVVSIIFSIILHPIGLSIAVSSVSEWLSPLQVTAMPDYPVAAGQTVNLHCTTFAVPNFINWSWQHLENLTWQVVGSGRDLALTDPKQSGLYRCRAETRLSQRVSRNLTVFIIGVQPTGWSALVRCISE